MDILNEKIEGLVKKAEKSGMPYSILKKVYDRGMAAWKTGHRPGTTPQQWAFARVNSFVTKSSGTWGKADKDLAKQVRGEDVEKRKNAKEMIGQVKEKLPKDADAGDYVKDFRKSDAPQFKGKSDKKKQKMAIAAYLDSKEEVEEERRQLKDPKKEAMVMKLKGSYAGNIQVIDKKELEKYLRKGYIQVEDNIKESVKLKYAVVDTSKNNEVIAMGSDEEDMQDTMRRRKERSLKVVKLKRPTKNDKMIGYPLKEETCPKCNEDPCKCKSLQESGHTDVASMKTQVQIAMDALQKMNTELGKLSDEEDLPTWWTNKVATAVGKLDGMADYIDAKHDQGEKMNEDNITEQFVHTVRFEKEGMRFAVPFYDKQKALSGKKTLQKSQGVSNISITKDLLKPGIKLAGEGKIVKESKMGAFFLDMQMDAQEMKERDFINKYKGEMGMSPQELKRMHKEFNEEVDNSLMAQATRVISQTSIKEKIDPADVDMKATAADRKAADKNIIIQLRRAQDMVKQTGRQDQTGIEFLDKKKQKVDSKIINKALDMFDRMKPNDKQKMQQSIGKSYRDLLKTVQRGRV